jgi:porphobilinogen synthase
VDNKDIPKDKKTYQMDANRIEAVKEALGCGRRSRYGNGKTRNCLFRHRTRSENAVNVPVYHVSGEYAMIKAAADGWIMTAP